MALHSSGAFAELIVGLHGDLVGADAREVALLALDVVDEAPGLLSAQLPCDVRALSLRVCVHDIVVTRGGLGRVLLDLVHAADLALVEVHVPRVWLYRILSR